MKATGHTDAYLAGTLTHAERLEVLKQLRTDLRAWLRSEAQELVDEFGEPKKGLVGDAAAAASKFFRRAAKGVRNGIAAGVLTLFGPRELTDAEVQARDHAVARQVEYLNVFTREVLDGTVPLAPPLVARAEMYGSAAWQEVQEAYRDVTIPSGGPGTRVEERRILGHPETDHCDECPELAERGWQPAGTLPRIGSTPCRSACLCHWAFRVVPIEREPGES